MNTGPKIAVDAMDLKAALFVEVRGQQYRVSLPPERMQLVVTLAGSLGDGGVLPLSRTQAAGQGTEALRALAERLLNPNDLGYAVRPEVRDAARQALGLPAVESPARTLALRHATWVEQVMKQAQTLACAWGCYSNPAIDGAAAGEAVDAARSHLRRLVVAGPGAQP